VDGDLVARLQAHRTFQSVPRDELEWIASHGTLEHCGTGDVVARKGEPVDALYVILSGHVSHFTDQGGTWDRLATDLPAVQRVLVMP
jgi:signal-transduction protein with cAMP-binding, CBS, and nucleotidyltransferase domain